MFSKKKKRKISVNNIDYYWVASGDDGWINLYVMTKVVNSPKMICQFDYHQDKKPFEQGRLTGVALSNQFVITPYIVRQAIEFGLANGWDPLHAGKDICFGHIDAKIDLRLKENKENVIKNK